LRCEWLEKRHLASLEAESHAQITPDGSVVGFGQAAVALVHEVSRESAHTLQHKQEICIQPPQQEIAPKHEHS